MIKLLFNFFLKGIGLMKETFIVSRATGRQRTTSASGEWCLYSVCEPTVGALGLKGCH